MPKTAYLSPTKFRRRYSSGAELLAMAVISLASRAMRPAWVSARRLLLTFATDSFAEFQSTSDPKSLVDARLPKCIIQTGRLCYPSLNHPAISG
jgi:hypothetical protein